MNAVQRNTVLGAAIAFALASSVAIAQDATAPQTEPAAQKSRPAEPAKTRPLDESSMPASQEPSARQPESSKPEASKSESFARAELNGTSVQRLTKLEDFDKNKDGSIAKDEVPANDTLALDFSSYDKDGDGKISQQEFAQYKNGNRQLASNKKAKPKQESKPAQQ